MSFLSPSASTAQPASENGPHSEAFQSWRWVFLAAILLAVVAIGAFYFSSVQAQTADGTITGLTLTSDAPGTLTVSWDTASPAPTDYRVNWAKSGEEYPSWKSDHGNVYPAGTATTVDITGLEHDTEYKIRLRARYHDGEHADSPWSGDWAEASLRVAGEPEPTPTPEPAQEEAESTPEPGAIVVLTATDDEAGQLMVTWEPPAAPHAEPTDYHVNWARSADEYPSDTEEDGNAHPTTTTHTLDNLEYDTEYKVRVRARYTDGENADSPWNGPWNETTAQVKQPLPAAPNIMGTALTPEGQVMLLWQNPSDDSITGYQVLRGPDADNLTVIEDDTGSSATSYTDTEPPPGQTHTYGVKARNSSGLSPRSNTVTATVPAAAAEEELTTAKHTDGENTLVSNLEQTAESSGAVAGTLAGSRYEIAMPFTTGFNPPGYHVTSVQLYIRLTITGTISPQVSIRSDNGGIPGETVLYTFTTSSAIPNDDFQLLSFTTADETKLQPNTRYWLYATTAGTNVMTIQVTQSDNEDAESDPAWRIGNVRSLRLNGGTWTASETANLRMKIRGHKAPPVLVSNVGQPEFHSVAVSPLQRQALSFTTGQRRIGLVYRFDGIRMQASSALVAAEVDIDLHDDNNGVPGERLLGLTTPHFTTAVAQYNDFTALAPQDSRLKSGARYWIVFRNNAVSDNFNAKITRSTAEDNDSIPTFKIGDETYRQEAGQSWAGYRYTIMMQVLGEEPGKELEPEAGDPPADTTTRGRLTVDGAGVTGRIYTLGGRPFNTPGDVDWYAVDLLANTYYQFDAHPINGRHYLLKIHNSAGTELRSSAITAVGTGYYQYPQRVNTLAFSKNEGGTYYVSIELPHNAESAERKYTLTARSDDYPADESTTAAVPGGGDLRTFESFQNYVMRTSSNTGDTATEDVDWIRVTLLGNVPYRFVYDVACRHEGIIEGVYTSAGTLVANSGASINRRTDGTCTDLTMPFTPTSDGDYFVAVTARGSDFPGARHGRAPFMGVWGTLTVVDTTYNPPEGDPLARGDRKVGETLTADISSINDADGLTDPMFEYQWQRVEGGTPADITGATSDTYTLTDDDVGKRIRLQVQFTDDGGFSETRTGPATSLIVPAAPRILVSNFNQTVPGSQTTTNISTGFVSGAHPHGYTIDSIVFRRTDPRLVSSPASSDEAEFRLYTSTSHNNARDRRPDTRIMTVSAPDRVQVSNIHLNAQSRVKLEPSTTYHVVLTTPTNETIGCSTVAGGGEDSDSLAGFDIIGRYYVYPDWSTGFTDDRSCTIQIKGFELESSNLVQSVEFTSPPIQPDMYATGELIEVTATLNQDVTFDGPPPVILLHIGDNERQMEYVASDSTDTSWVFRYTVVTDDRDDDGVSIKHNALRGYADADLSHYGITNDQTSHVNAAPRVVSQRVSSSPLARFWYGPGEKIQFTVEFSLPVTVVGNPRLEFDIATPGPQKEFASYLSGSGTRELVFSYTVLEVDGDGDGIEWNANSLRVVDGVDEITGTYNGLDAILDHTALNRLEGHLISQNPRNVSMEVTSDPEHGTDSDTYGAGDAITFEVVFNQAVTVTGVPRLPFRIGNTGTADVYAAYVSGSGTDTLVFSYTVLATDTDTNGIYTYGSPIVYPDTATDTIVGASNNLPEVNSRIDNEGRLPGHKIDGTITN